MSAAFYNAAPLTNMLGTEDNSTRQLVPEPEAIPQHLPHIYLYTKKGPTDPQLVVGDGRTQMYGIDSFDTRLPWATHATELANLVNAAGNAAMIQRVQPTDAAPPASIRLYIDLLPTTLPVWERNSDGTYRLNENGDRIPSDASEVSGYRAKFVLEEINFNSELGDTFGQAQQLAGDQVDENTHVQSQRYPIMDIRASSFGAWGNDQAIRLWAPTTLSNIPIDKRILANEKVYPFRMACMSRTNELSTPTTVTTNDGAQWIDVCLKPGTIDRNTDSKLFIGDVFLQAYQDLNPVTDTPPKFGPFGEFHLYNAKIAEVLNLVYAAEIPFMDGYSDFKGDLDEQYRFNLLSGVTSDNVPYYSYQVITGVSNSVRLAESAVVYAQGGNDGTMNEDLFADLVSEAVAEYANPDSPLQDMAKYPVTWMWDSGFPIATKKALVNFIAVRKDTIVVLSTHDVLGRPLTPDQEYSLAVSLRTRLQMFPESEYFGTHCMRGMIVAGSGTLLKSNYNKPLPLTLEIAAKMADYMGASNGAWTPGKNFDRAKDKNGNGSAGNDIVFFTDINNTFTPAAVRIRDWDAGLIRVESFSRRKKYFPAFKTVYDNDTSVLNSIFTVAAIAELEKVGKAAHRQFTGSSSLTNQQIVEEVNKFILANTSNRFDGRFVIVPETYFTQADLQRGFSWTTMIKVYASGQKTAMTFSIQSNRIEDLQS